MVDSALQSEDEPSFQGQVDGAASESRRPGALTPSAAPVENPPTVTVLTCYGNLRLTKRYTVNGTDIQKEEDQHPRTFRHHGFGVRNLTDLYQLLDRISDTPQACLIRGMPREGLGQGVDRTNENFPMPAGGIPWSCIDFDSVKLPEGMDPYSREAVDYAVKLLPSEFHDVSYIGQFSASAGVLKPDGSAYKPGLRAHVFFWLQRGVSNEEMNNWLRGCPIDFSLFQEVQAHYIADPKLGEGVQCALKERLFMVTKALEAVPVPKLAVAPVRVYPSGGHNTDKKQQGDLTGKHPLGACRFIQYCQKEAPTLTEPLWYAVACNLAGTKGGREFYHKISETHPNYTPAETDKKFDQAFAQDKPHTCRTIAGKGFKCPVMQEDGSCHIHGGHAPVVFETADQVQAMVAELNQIHAVIHAGSTLVLSERDDPSMKRKVYETESLMSFRNWYLNRKIGDDSAATLWLNHPNRRQFQGLVFAPGEKHPGFFNLFRGFPIDPKPGDASVYWELVKTVICGGNDKYYTYVRKWLAHLFQKPNVLPETAIVLRGKQGTGKNTFVGAIGRLVGQHYLELVNMNQLVGRFNSHLKDALLVHANEAVWGGDKQSVGAIKAMITDPICAVEQKGKDIISLKNYKRLIVSSNENWSVPCDLDDRRFFVLDVSECHKEDEVYFAKIDQTLQGDGLAALMHDLITEDISNFKTRAMPQNNNNLDLKIMSSGSVTKWWYQILRDAELRWNVDPSQLDSKKSDWPDFIPKAALHGRYLNWCNDQKIHHPEIPSEFGKQLTKLIPSLSVGQRTVVKPQTWVYLLPPLEECRKRFEKEAKIEGYNWDTAV